MQINAILINCLLIIIKYFTPNSIGTKQNANANESAEC